MQDIDEIYKKFYSPRSQAFKILKTHSQLVMEKALKIAEHYGQEVDKDFIVYGALLHDIGIVHTYAPGIGCHGDKPYIAHGYLGREMLEKIGLTEIAPVCERHIGVGIKKDEILQKKLPLPVRDMIPLRVEEKIITIADKYYSKTPGRLSRERSVDEIIQKLEKHGKEKVSIFFEMCRELNWPVN